MDSNRSEISSAQTENNFQGVHMSTLVESATSVRIMIDVVAIFTSKKVAHHQFSREIGTTERRVKSLYYGEARRVDGDEVDRIRKVKAKYVEQFESQAARLEAVDPDMFRDDIARLRGQAERLRTLAH